MLVFPSKLELSVMGPVICLPASPGLGGSETMPKEGATSQV